MKVFVISSSLNGVLSDTELILQPFIKGMKDSGAQVEQVNTIGMVINPCRACTKELTFHPDGSCDCEDDMQLLYPKFKDADIWVFASAIETNRIPPILINILDRLEPLFQVSTDFININETENKGKVVFVSTSPARDKEAFDEIENEMKVFSRLYSREYSGSLLRPHSWALQTLENIGVNNEDIFRAAYQAGIQLILEGKIPPSTSKAISRQLIPNDISFLNV